jgi:hypothetical protein
MNTESFAVGVNGNGSDDTSIVPDVDTYDSICLVAEPDNPITCTNIPSKNPLGCVNIVFIDDAVDVKPATEDVAATSALRTTEIAPSITFNWKPTLPDNEPDSDVDHTEFATLWGLTRHDVSTTSVLLVDSFMTFPTPVTLMLPDTTVGSMKRHPASSPMLT